MAPPEPQLCTPDFPGAGKNYNRRVGVASVFKGWGFKEEETLRSREGFGQPSCGTSQTQKASRVGPSGEGTRPRALKPFPTRLLRSHLIPWTSHHTLSLLCGVSGQDCSSCADYREEPVSAREQALNSESQAYGIQ